jgi:hypothetical protein
LAPLLSRHLERGTDAARFAADHLALEVEVG